MSEGKALDVDAPPTLLDQIHFWFWDLPAAWIAIDTIALAAFAAWLAYKYALPFYRVMQALQTAPRATVNSGAIGLVKIVGEAQPGQVVPEGFAKPSHVWRKRETFDTRKNRGLDLSRSRSVAPILIQDESGACVVDPLEAIVIPAHKSGHITPHFGSHATYHTEKTILPGDPVFAIGVLRHGKHKRGEVNSHGSLRKSDGGVLLLSGQTEERTVLRFRILWWMTASVTVVCAGLALWMFHQHLSSYPNGSLGEYADALVTRPWVLGPGQNAENR